MSSAEGQSVELQLCLDGEGRTVSAEHKPDGTGNAIDYSSKAVMSELSSPIDITERREIMDDLLFDAEIADCGLLPRTFWMPCEGRKAQCRLEKMALEVFRHHVPVECNYDAATSGAEWWVQIRPSPPAGRYSMHAKDDSPGAREGDNQQEDMSKKGISYHWDKDEDLRLMMGGTMNIHPHISTVTYLTDLGAPTVVLNHRVDNLTGEYLSPPSNSDPEAFVSWPSRGKHLSFDGRYLHAAPGDLMDIGEFEEQCRIKEGKAEGKSGKEVTTVKRRHRRVTFLVNIWLNHKPFNVEPFPEGMLDKLSGSLCGSSEECSKIAIDGNNIIMEPILFAETSRSDVKRSPTLESVISSQKPAPESRMFVWPMGGSGSDEFLHVIMPMKRIRAGKESCGNISIKWKADNGGNGFTSLPIIKKRCSTSSKSEGGNKDAEQVCVEANEEHNVAAHELEEDCEKSSFKRQKI